MSTRCRAASTLILALVLAWPGVVAAADAVWAPVRAEGCEADGVRRYTSTLRVLVPGVDPKSQCPARELMGAERTPVCTVAFDWRGLVVRGEWKIPDSACLKSLPARAAPQPYPSGTSLSGYADLHVHQMAHLGFGGSTMWGGAFGLAHDALRPIPSEYKHGHDIMEAAVDGHILETLSLYFLGVGRTHDEDGYPTFRSWPSYFERQTHQQVYEDWLFRAYRGGLRLMVMLAENSEDMFGRGENSIPIVGGINFVGAKAPARSGNDMEAAEWQIREAYRMQAAIDARHGGDGWYRIVRNPDEAERAMGAGKLAVLLGVEIQHLFNCDLDRECSETIERGLDRLEALGVSYVFPIHHKANRFGGPARFVPLNSGGTEPCPDKHEDCSDTGLTQLGKELVRDLMRRGMLIDTEHMSSKAFDDTLAIADTHYPLMAGHVVPFDLQAAPEGQTERARTTRQLMALLRGGGVIAPLLGASAGEFVPSGETLARVPIACTRVSGGGVDQWANFFLYVRSLQARLAAGNQVQPPPIALGSDFNGIAGWPGPRGGNPGNCSALYEGPIRWEPAVTWPFALPAFPAIEPRIIERELATTPATDPPAFDQRALGLYAWEPDRRQCVGCVAPVVWDYNRVGVAHAGLLPEFLENLRLLGLTLDDLRSLYDSAHGVVEVWRKARKYAYAGSAERWLPKRPFDVVELSPEFRPALPKLDDAGHPICRTSDGRIGFERADACIVGGATLRPLAPVTTPILGYDAGRCIDEGRHTALYERALVQQPCSSDAATQRWRIETETGGALRIVNEGSQRCIAHDDGTRVVARRCSADDPSQRWQARRHGNTFTLGPQEGTGCLEVSGQTRKAGAPIELVRCDESGTGEYASSRLWIIEALRTNDYDLLRANLREAK